MIQQNRSEQLHTQVPEKDMLQDPEKVFQQKLKHNAQEQQKNITIGGN
ncbi:hypothetical protein [Fictibacillus macauensis]|nr:hypothetical protein [Fictibacillus macauensis]